MNLTGQIILKKDIFQYSFTSKNKVVIRSFAPAKLSVIRKVRKEIQHEIETKIEVQHEIFYDFKSQP